MKDGMEETILGVQDIVRELHEDCKDDKVMNIYSSVLLWNISRMLDIYRTTKKVRDRIKALIPSQTKQK